MSELTDKMPSLVLKTKPHIFSYKKPHGVLSRQHRRAFRPSWRTKRPPHQIWFSLLATNVWLVKIPSIEADSFSARCFHLEGICFVSLAVCDFSEWFFFSFCVLFVCTIDVIAQWGQFSFSKPLCSTNVIVFYLAYLALAGLMNLLAQLSDRIIHFGEYNLMPLAFLTKLSIMHWILCTKMDYPIW